MQPPSGSPGPHGASGPAAPPALEEGPFRRLAELGAGITAYPLTTVVAPAGSGKSTLLARWRRDLPDGVRSVWLDTLPLHGDAATWVGDLLEALQPVVPAGVRFGEPTRLLLSNLSGGDEDWRLLHRSLLRDWLAVEGQTVLFLDNFHTIASGSSTDQLVSEWLRNPPANLHVVVASRGTLPSAALRLAAGGTAQELGFDALNFRFDEATELLRSRGVEPDSELVTMLLGRTEGWVTGLLLAARVLARIPRDERLGYAERIGRERDLFAYVASEVLAGESEALIRLLECAAVIGRAEPEALCNLADEPGVAEHLDEALDHGLLLSDGRDVWPHQLWQDLLRARLRKRLGPEAWRALHGRAARLLAERGRVEDALEAYRESEEWEAMAYLIHGVGHEWLDRGRWQDIRRWLNALPAELRETEPALLEMQGMLLSQVNRDEATRLLEAAAQGFARRGDRVAEHRALGALSYHQLASLDLAGTRRTMRRGLGMLNLLRSGGARAEVYNGLAAFTALRSRFGRALRLGERARRQTLSPVSRWFNTALLGLVYALAGELEKARRVLDEALEDPAIVRRVFAYYSLLALRAYVQARLGDLSAARRDIETAQAAFEDFGLFRFRPIGSLIAADVYALLGDREACEREFEEAVRTAAKDDGLTLEALGRGQMAIRWYGWGELERARAEALRSAEAHERGVAEGVIAFPWWLCVSLWILGRLDDPKAAWRRLQPHRRELERADLPLTSTMMLLAMADLADRAGEAAEGRALAIRAWRLAERSQTALDRIVLPHVLPYGAEEALRQDVAADLAFAALRRMRPDAVPEVLGRLARDRDARVRLRAIERMGEFGGRALHGALERACKDRNAGVRAAAERLLPALDLRPDHALRLESLGRFQAFRDDEVIPDRDWRGSMSQRVLFRLLCAEGRPVPREALQVDLWPDASESAGRNNLRVALSRLSDALDPDRLAGSPGWFVSSGPGGVALDLSRVAFWDVRAFREASRRAETLRGEGRMEEALEAYAQAVGHHAGPFLPEVPYEEWAAPLRRRLDDELRGVGERYGALLLDGALHDRALSLAERLLEQDPTDEAAWALRMKAQLVRGDRAAASRTFEHAREALRTALEIEPGERLRDLAARARSAR